MPVTNKAVYTRELKPFASRWAERVICRKRARMTAMLDATIAAGGSEIGSAIDIGSSSDTALISSNYMARETSGRCELTLLSDQRIDAASLDFPVRHIVQCDATRLSDRLGRFDLVMSSATIEHVGSAADQARFLGGCLDLANRILVVTTPNRWHPLEFHTRLPILHWLPKRWHRWILQRIGMTFFAEEAHLNLLDRRSFVRLIETAPRRDRIADWRLETVRFCGFVSNLVLIVWLRPERPPGLAGLPHA